MNRTRCCLIVTVLAVVLSISAVARPRLPEDMQPYLIAQAHPELSQIASIQVAIVSSGAVVNKDDSFWKNLRAEVEQKLKQAGLKIPDPTRPDRRVMPFDVPQFDIHIDLLKLEEAQQYALLVRTSLARPVHLALRKPASENSQAGPMLNADVWGKSSPMQAAAFQHTPAAITQIVLQQTEEFIVNWTAANPPGKQAADADETKIVAQKPTTQPTKSPPAEYKYVASKNSTVFHLAGCSSAARISSGNLVGYKTRDEAINAGKRPCKLCKP